MKKSILFLTLFALCATGVLPAPFDVRIKQILDPPYKYAGEIIRLEGKVIQFTEIKTASTRIYILQDDWGGKIEIITNNATLPEVGHRYLVTGMLFVENPDKEKPEIKIIETSREIPPIERQGDTTQWTGTTTPDKKNEYWLKLMFGIAAVFLVVIAFLSVLMLNRKKEGFTSSSSSNPGFTDSGLGSFPEPSSFIEDSSIKFAAPPDVTLILCPGRLEIIDGCDKHKNIKFFKPKNKEETEFTFGREVGEPYIHIQLKSPTVSAKQAKIMWTNGRYMLLNYSTTNPTKVNDKILKKGQSVILDDYSTIEMGEIILKFHDK